MFVVDAPPIWIALLAGFLSFISPCVLPLVPAYVSYLGARAGQQAAGELAFAGGPRPALVGNRAAIFLHGVMFVLGFTLVFVVFGLAVNTGFKLLSVSFYDLQITIARVGGIIVIFFGLHILGVTGLVLRWLTAHVPAATPLGVFFARLTAWLYGDTRMQMNPRSRKGYSGSLVMGVIFAAGWTPCVGPIYGSILTIASNGSTASAAWLLTAYSLGMGIPFLLAAAMIDRIKPLLRRIQKRMRMIELVSGVLLIFMGYLLFTNQLGEIAGRLTGLADFSYNVEECVTGAAQGKVAGMDFSTCMQVGPNYKYRITPTP